MSSVRAPRPSAKDLSGLKEIGGMIMSRFPEAVIDVRPSSDERGAWMLLVYLDNEDDKYAELAGLVYGRLAELRYDEGVKIEMLPFDKAYQQAIERYMRAVYSLRTVAGSQVVDLTEFARLEQDREHSESVTRETGEAMRRASQRAKGRRSSHA